MKVLLTGHPYSFSTLMSSDVTGNASEQIKIFLKDVLHIFGEEKPYFASSILARSEINLAHASDA